ncbi:diphthine synthase, partial [Ascosphaera atra]
LAIGAARVGSPEQMLVCGTLRELCEADLGAPLHSLVLVGKRAHELERDYIREFAVSKETFDKAWEGNYGKM